MTGRERQPFGCAWSSHVQNYGRASGQTSPTFANGRTQDIVMTLHKHLPELDVHVDGMGKHVAKLQMEHPEALRDPRALEDAWKWCRRVSSKSDKKKAKRDCRVVKRGCKSKCRKAAVERRCRRASKAFFKQLGASRALNAKYGKNIKTACAEYK